ncbi:MAG: hypothetical protein NC307_05665 [Roseburia sp.]|nr:hypothetical protein [Roseburia sp.]
MALTGKICSVGQEKVLEEIINNAIELPVESQNVVLMMAKAMRFTRACVTQQNLKEQKTGDKRDEAVF